MGNLSSIKNRKCIVFHLLDRKPRAVRLLGVICPLGSLLILKDIEVRTFSGAPPAGTVPGVPGGERAGALCPTGFCCAQPWALHGDRGQPLGASLGSRGAVLAPAPVCPGQAAWLPLRAAQQRGAWRSGFAYNYSDGIIFLKQTVHKCHRESGSPFIKTEKCV